MTPQELAELDLAVAKAEGFHYAEAFSQTKVYPAMVVVSREAESHRERYQPTRDSAEAMRLMEKYRLMVRPHCGEPPKDEAWTARAMCRDPDHDPIIGDGATPAIAICRAVVALKGGK